MNKKLYDNLKQKICNAYYILVLTEISIRAIPKVFHVGQAFGKKGPKSSAGERGISKK